MCKKLKKTNVAKKAENIQQQKMKTENVDKEKHKQIKERKKKNKDVTKRPKRVTSRGGPPLSLSREGLPPPRTRPEAGGNPPAPLRREAQTVIDRGVRGVFPRFRGGSEGSDSPPRDVTLFGRFVTSPDPDYRWALFCFTWPATPRIVAR